MATNLLSGDFTVNGNSATDVYNTVVTDSNLATGGISAIIENRVNDVLFNGKTKSYN